MAEDARKIVEEYVNAWRDNDQERLKDLVDESATFRGQPPGYGEDRESMLKLADDYHKAFSDIKMDYDHWTVGDEGRVALRFKGRGKHTGEFLGVKPSNNQIDAEGLILATVRDGKIVEDITEVDAMGMLAQMGGLPEQLSP